MNKFELEYQGLILDKDTISELDFRLGNDNPLIIPENKNKERHFYNQGLLKGEKPYFHTGWSCGLFGTMGVISDLTGYEFTEKDREEIQKLAVDEYGLQVPGGMYMHKAVDCLRNWWNAKFPDNKLMSFRLKIGDDDFAEALKKKHSLVVGYRTSPEYYKDSQDDGIITGEDFPKKGGHLVRTNFLTKAIKIDDNYFGTKKWNTYTNNKIAKLQENGVFFPSAYLFLYDTSMEDEIRSKIDLEGAKEAFDLGIYNGLDSRKPVSRQEVAVMIIRGIGLILKLLSKILKKDLSIKDLEKETK